MQIFDIYGAPKKKFHILEGRTHREKRLPRDLEVGLQFFKKILLEEQKDPADMQTHLEQYKLPNSTYIQSLTRSPKATKLYDQ